MRQHGGRVVQPEATAVDPVPDRRSGASDRSAMRYGGNVSVEEQKPVVEGTTNVGGAAAGETPVQERSVLEEFKGLGEHLAAAMRAAATTAEAEALKGDLQEGLRDLRVEIDKALQAAKPAGRVPASGKAGEQVRSELASALRSLNKVLERTADSISRVAAEDAPTQPNDAGPTES
jgi:hypothetical protein